MKLNIKQLIICIISSVWLSIIISLIICSTFKIDNEKIKPSFLTIIQDSVTKRVSSWDKTGRNFDYWIIKGKSSVILTDIKGPGCITHIWMTADSTKNKYHYKKVMLKMYWDDEKEPSVISPVGEFFCLGHSMVNSFNSLAFAVSACGSNKLDGRAGMNCYLPMPFNKGARIELENGGDNDFIQYFHIDYELYKNKIENNVGYFHAQWNSESCEADTKESNPVNLKGQENYILLEAEGQGQYIGCNLSVIKKSKEWWGEGDEMIFIDGDKNPTINGTGTEDYFGQSWGTQNNRFLYNGSSLCDDYTGGFHTFYVFHLHNPIRFNKSIKVTIEHGSGNNQNNPYSSVAYWYQKEPHKMLLYQGGK